MKTAIRAMHAAGDFATSVANFCDRHKTKTLWGIFALLPAGIGLLALAAKLNSTSGWFFWPAIIMIIAGGVVVMDFGAKTGATSAVNAELPDPGNPTNVP